MIDPSIIINGSRYADQIQARNSEGLQNLIGVIGQIGYDSKLRKMRQLENQQDRQAFANNSIFTNKLNTQLTADNAAKAKAANDQLVFNANLAKTYGEIGKTGAETGKLGAETGKITTDTGITRQNNTGSIWSAFLTGGPVAAKAQLENAKANGVINEAAYQYESNAINNLATMPNAAEQQQYAMGRFKGLQDPKYSLTTADNVLDNETTVRGQDITKTVADNRLGFDYQKEEADNQFKYDSLGQDDNQFWASFNQKDAQFYSDQDFQLMKAKIEKQQVKNETPEQKMERVNNVIGSADAARQAARAAVDAAALIKHPGIVSGTGLTSFMGMVPSTDAKDFKARLENLKSQVFLPTVKSLQGMGALSNAEGEKIASAVANLDPSIGQEAMAKQLTILAQEMSNSAKKAQKQTQNYATRGGTIQLQTQNRGNNQGGKVYTQAMIQQYASESGRTTQEVAQAVRDSGGTIRQFAERNLCYKSLITMGDL